LTVNLLGLGLGEPHFPGAVHHKTLEHGPDYHGKCSGTIPQSTLV